METKIWNLEARKAYLGILICSVLGVLSAIFRPLARLERTMQFLSILSEQNTNGTSVGFSILYTLLELGIILGFFVFLKAIKGLRYNTEGQEKGAFDRIYYAIIINIVSACLEVIHVFIVAGILGLISSILLLSAYSSLKNSNTIAKLSSSAVSGFNLLFIAEILVLIAIVLNWIPIIRILGAILNIAAWVFVIIGWHKVSVPVSIPGEDSQNGNTGSETIVKEMIDSIKDLKNGNKSALEQTKETASENKESETNDKQ